MRTYFIRHSGDLALDDVVLARLRRDRMIAVHFPFESDGDRSASDSESIDPNRYARSGKAAIGALRELATEGGYVCATYRDTKTILIGRVRGGTPIRLIREKWSADSIFPGRIAVLKALELQSVIEVPAAKQALLLSLAPQQGTCCRWSAVRTKVEDLVEARPWTMDRSFLNTSYQEVMCSEYLRTHEIEGFPRLRHLLQPVGRTMKGVDILGLADDGKAVLGQVTFGRSLSKLRDFCGYSDAGKNHLVYFCETDSVRREGDVLIVPLGHVYDCFSSTDGGREWLRKAHDFL